MERGKEWPVDPGLVVLIASDEIGTGPSELGQILMGSFLRTLGEVAPIPHRMIFINSGVRLMVEGSQFLDDLAGLAEAGIDLSACTSCLDYFELKEKLRVGRATNMRDIAAALMQAGRVVRP